MGSNPEVIIRRATPGDAEVIALLGRITFGETFGHLFHDPTDLLAYYDRTFSVSKISNSLKKENNVYWLALADKLPVGYAKLKLNSPTPFLDDKNICQLQKIYVLKDFLSLKIGLGLQEELIGTARETGSNYIWLSVLKENKRAVNFYFKNGFDEIGDHGFSIGKEDFEFMAMARAFE